MPDDDQPVTWHQGRAFLNESSISIPKDKLTQDERATMDANRLAEAEGRQARADANLAAALRLGAALRVLKGED
ncbi:MAG: hypothetical protein QNJ13_07700 [Paracoccaceae bacterium]|nr:hypothetical protein [Paracoccaceae bacterium]